MGTERFGALLAAVKDGGRSICPGCLGEGTVPSHPPAPSPDQQRRAIAQDARREAQAMTDEQLGQYLVWLRRCLTLAEEDETAAWLVEWDAIRLAAGEQEWDWRKRAESRGGPMLGRANWRERLEAVRARNPIDRVAAEFTVLQRAGSNLKGLCPLHQEKTPSFVVWPDKGNWKCFGCGAGGDVFALVELAVAGDFVSAVKWLEGHIPASGQRAG